MTPALRIIASGPCTTVQGNPRIGYQAVGVPASGPLDRIALRLANALVGNSHDAPALEMLLQGPTCEVAADSVRIALVGCSAGLEIRSATPRVIPAGQSVRLTNGEIFRIGLLGDTACAYLAVEGGFDITPVLGSVSTYVRGGIGGMHGRRLQKGDELPLRTASAQTRAERVMSRPFDPALDQPIRVVLGPQDEYFTREAIRTFLTSTYTISPQADRMGFRLEGPVLQHARGYDIISDGVVPGSVQVPGSGCPIILMVDNQTTGGYPKIATVISADMPVAGRRRPGRAIRFASVELDEAERLRRKQEAAILEEIGNFRVVAGAAGTAAMGAH
jgi:allophanate hydrolase